ncbi:putative Amastin surface glycoprotein [Leishmania shawi]|uniref:Amastin surface glycoprotein n=1 Tax=Leishmania shawi TaxID=5680 RepID=A0AAW3CBX2_9TRYP
MGFEALHGRMDVALNMLCSCTVFMFLVTSAPISQFRGSGIRTDGSGGASKLACVTSWGLKNDCNNNHYDYRSTSITCARSRQLFQVAQAFYIIAVIVSFLGIKAKVALIVLGFLEVVVALIPWVCMTAVWHNDYCGQSTVMINASSGKANGVPYGSVLRTAFKMSAGYGMTVTAWCVQVVGLTLLLTM